MKPRQFTRVLFVTILVLVFSLKALAFDGQAVSRHSKDWHYKVIGPRELTIFKEKFTQTDYIFQNSTSLACIRDCPYAYPAWDGTIDSVNAALTYLGLPSITKLVHTKDWTYTDPDYPEGEIIIMKGKYFDHLSKVMMRYYPYSVVRKRNQATGK